MSHILIWSILFSRKNNMNERTISQTNKHFQMYKNGSSHQVGVGVEIIEWNVSSMLKTISMKSSLDSVTTTTKTKCNGGGNGGTADCSLTIKTDEVERDTSIYCLYLYSAARNRMTLLCSALPTQSNTRINKWPMRIKPHNIWDSYDSYNS